MLQEPGFLKAVSGCQTGQLLSVIKVSSLYLHVYRGLIINGTFSDRVIIDGGSVTVWRRDRSRGAGLGSVQKWARMSAVCHQTEASITGFSQVMGVACVHTHFAGGSSLISLR